MFYTFALMCHLISYQLFALLLQIVYYFGMISFNTVIPHIDKGKINNSFYSFTSISIVLIAIANTI